MGRRTLGREFLNRLYPIVRPIAAVYRRTLLRRVKIISVIGSLGKSTACRAIAIVVRDTKLEGFSNNNTLIVLNMLKHRPSSPYAVLETAIKEPGYMAGYASMLKPDIVVVTSIASEHILTFGSLKNIRSEKSKMLLNLSPEKTAILNADDPNVMWMSTLTRARIITYGIHEKSCVHAKNIQINPPAGMECDVAINKKSYRLKIPWLGRHLIYPALAALAVAVAEGIDIPESCRNLEKLKTVEGRMQGVVLPSGAVLIRDDCKATRESVWSALETLSEYPAERKFLVLGGVSEILNNERYAFFRDLGSRISKAADYGYLHMNKHGFRCCRVGAAAGGMNRDRLTRIKLDPLSILHLLPDDLGKGDVILVKGRPDYRISRLSLALMEREVNCRIMSCPITTSFCDDCSMLKQGWQGRSRAKKIGSWIR